jgi:NDP-sugar pyrophosphorylase family protein
MRAIILAGGLGTRLAPYTTIIPKPLMPLGNRPILEIILCQLCQHGFTRVTLAVGYLSHLLEAYFGDGRRFDMTIDYSFEEQPLGTAGPLTLIPNVEEPILVMNGDVLTTLNFADLFAYHCQNHADITVGLHATEVKIELGVLELSSTSEVLDYVEKPTFSYLTSMGIYVVEPHIVAQLPKRKRVDFPDMVRMALKQGEKVLGYVFEGEWLDIGRPEDYERAADMIERPDGPLAPRHFLHTQRPLSHTQRVLSFHKNDGRV